MIYRYLKNAAHRLLNREREVSEENEACIARMSKAGQRIVFVSSYPRSGNTWIRHILADCFIQNMNHSTSTDLPVHPDRIIPDRYVNRISERDSAISTPGLFVKTHDRFAVALELVDRSAQNNMRHLYIFRRPEDVLVSYFHYHRRYDHLREKTEMGVDEFVLCHLDDWLRHVKSYIEAKSTHPDSVVLLSYERLLANPLRELRPVFSWLEIEIELSTLENAISHMSFENLRAKEEKDPLNNREMFFRKGTSGSGRHELLASTLETISFQSSTVLRKMDQLLAEQSNARETVDDQDH